MDYFFKSPIDVDLHLDNEEERTFVDYEFEQGRKDKAPIYESDETVKGTVSANVHVQCILK